MCSFCENGTKIKTTLGDDNLIVSLDDYCKELLQIRVERGSIASTRPIRISHCPFCGKRLKINIEKQLGIKLKWWQKLYINILMFLINTNPFYRF